MSFKKGKRSCRIPVLFFAAVVSLSLLLGGCGFVKINAADSRNADSVPFEAVFYDVGKGDCILFSTGGGNVLVDTGYEENADDIIRQLKDRGVDRLEAMIITHYDKDHVGGAARIANKIPVSNFYLPNYIGEKEKCGELLNFIGEKGVSAARVAEDRSFTLGDTRFSVDAAMVNYDPEIQNDNDASLIVEVFYGKDSWLLPGDIDEAAIDAWLSSRGRHYDVLKYPHHGKKEDNAKELIKTVSPSIAVITDSDEQEASEKVLKKLEKEEADIYRSSVNGTITIDGDGSGHFKISTQK